MSDSPKAPKDQSTNEIDFSTPKLPPWMPPPRPREQRWMEEAADSCLFKGAMSAVMGTDIEFFKLICVLIAKKVAVWVPCLASRSVVMTHRLIMYGFGTLESSPDGKLGSRF